MKKTILIIIISIVLSGCEPVCRDKVNTDNKLRAELFDKCMERAVSARSGQSYTTHDDEDFDEVVYACDSVSRKQSTEYNRKHCENALEN